MNTVRKALELAEELLQSRHWVRIRAYDNFTFIEGGPIHDNGVEESPTYLGTITSDGRVTVGHQRI